MLEKILNIISLIADAIMITLLGEGITNNIKYLYQEQFDSTRIIIMVLLLAILYFVIRMTHHDWKQMIDLACK